MLKMLAKGFRRELIIKCVGLLTEGQLKLIIITLVLHSIGWTQKSVQLRNVDRWDNPPDNIVHLYAQVRSRTCKLSTFVSLISYCPWSNLRPSAINVIKSCCYWHVYVVT